MGCGSSSSSASTGATAPVSWSNVKLTYFDLRGRAETIRLLLHINGIAFKDNRVTQEEWAKLKTDTPFGQLPILEVGTDMKLGQSMAIARFIAAEKGMAGGNEEEAAVMDSIVDTCGDIGAAFGTATSIKDEEQKAEAVTKFWGETVPKYFGCLETLLSSNNGGDGYFVGSKLSWADVHFYDISFTMYEVAPDGTGLKESHPKLFGLHQRVAAHSKVAEWAEKRPKTQF